jgi:hypothetical protein
MKKISMRRSPFLLALAVAAIAMPAAGQRPISLGIGGGAVFPTGKLQDAVKLGWRALATVAVSSPMQPLGLRLDVAYDRFAFKDEVAAADETLSIGSATLNFTYRLPMTRSAFSPYLITGLGAYQSQCSDDGVCGSTTKFGWNGGLGTRINILGMQTFLETRFHSAGGAETTNRFFSSSFGLFF